MGALPEQTPVYPVHTLCPQRPEEGARVRGNGITNDSGHVGSGNGVRSSGGDSAEPPSGPSSFISAISPLYANFLGLCRALLGIYCLWLRVDKNIKGCSSREIFPLEAKWKRLLAPSQDSHRERLQRELVPCPPHSARRSALLVVLLSTLHSTVLNEKLERPCFVITS